MQLSGNKFEINKKQNIFYSNANYKIDLRRSRKQIPISIEEIREMTKYGHLKE